MCQFGGRKDGRDIFASVACEEPLFDESADVVELGDFDEDGRHGGWAAGDELQIADGGEVRFTTALSVLPAFALLEAKGGKKTGETVKISA